MIHKDYEEKFFLWHDGELSDDQIVDLENHMAQCADCAALSKKWKQLAAVVAALPEQENNSGFVHRVMLRLPQQESAISFLRRPVFGWGLGFAALLLLVIFKLRPEPVGLDALLLDTEQSASTRADELLGINVEDSSI